MLIKNIFLSILTTIHVNKNVRNTHSNVDLSMDIGL